MPADKRRKLVALRLLQEDVELLDSLAVRKTTELGRIVHRSEFVTALLHAANEASKSKRPNGRSRATAE